MAKRYYWLKLSEDFFSETCIKALRRLPSGDSLVIVYLKMQLKSLKTEGLLKYCGLLPDSTAELAMALDEDENVVRLTIEALIRFKLVERWEDETLYISAVQELIGSEGSSAERVRKHRQLQSGESNIHVSAPCAQCNTENSENVLHCNGEIDIELEKDKEIEPELELEQEKETPPKSPAGEIADVTAQTSQTKQREKMLRERFNAFWQAYPKKQGKGAAEAAWKKLKPSEELTQRMLESLEQAKKCAQWQKEGGQYIPNPATWLNRAQWDDEYPAGDWKSWDGLGKPSYDLEEVNRLILDSAIQGARMREGSAQNQK